MEEELELELEVVPKKYRCFTFVLYEDTSSYNFSEVLFNLKAYKYWAYIKHDHDDGKKLHYHFIIYLENATTLSSISKKTGVPIQHIQYVKNIRAMCRYLIHFDDPDKFQYDLSDVRVSRLWERKFLKHFEDIKTEEEIINDIYYWIENNHYDNAQVKLMYLIMWVNSSCYDSVYKRYRYEFLDFLKYNL